MSREAIAQKLDQQLQRPERIRQWSYDFDPAGLEILRRAIEHVVASKPDAVKGAEALKGADASKSADPVAV
jgi:hypothetical protein